MLNTDIADLFDEIATLLAFDDINPFRVRAYRDAARMLRRNGPQMADLLKEDMDLTKLPTIGDDLARLIDEAVSTGRIRSLDALRRATPPGAFAYLKIEGIGPKKAKALSDRLGDLSYDELYEAALDHEIQKVPGFGPVSEMRFLKAIDVAMNRRTQKRISRGEAAPIVEAVISHLEDETDIARAVVAGSFRRREPSVGDLDIVALGHDAEKVIARLINWSHVNRVVSAGQAKATVILDTGLQVDLRVAEEDNFGSMLLYFTGSKAYNIAIRTRAKRQGLKLNEYGLWQGEQRIAGKTEEDIFAALGLEYCEPEHRQHGADI